MPRWRDRRGNVAMMMGLLAVPLISLVGLAVDFGNATWAHSKLDGAADAAALLATTVASNQYRAGVANPTAAAISAATDRFNAMVGITPPQYGFAPNVSLSPVTITMTQSGGVFTSNVSYAGSYQTFLGGLVKVPSIALGGTSAASLSASSYVDIQVLMDVSSSMTIAATQTDITNMGKLTTNYKATSTTPSNADAGTPCGFACHWSSNNDDYLALARSNNVTLRIDVLSAAVGNLITNIASLNTSSSFRLGLSTFNAGFAQIYPASTSNGPTSSDISGARSALAQIAPDINPCSSDSSCPETNFDNAMAKLAKNTQAPGDGSTQAKAQQYLFIVSDGLVDADVPPRAINPINPATCQALKQQGVTIFTLYTYYNPLTTNNYYNQHVLPYQPNQQPNQPNYQDDQINQAMVACASSPSLAFQATDASQIDAQLQQLLAAAVALSSGHLTI